MNRYQSWLATFKADVIREANREVNAGESGEAVAEKLRGLGSDLQGLIADLDDLADDFEFMADDDEDAEVEE